MRRHNQVTYFREPCIGDREGAGEALVAERMGWAIERRKVDRLECRGKTDWTGMVRNGRTLRCLRT